MTRWDHQPGTNMIFATTWHFGGGTVERFLILGTWRDLVPWMRLVEQRHEKELIAAAMKKYRRWASEGVG